MARTIDFYIQDFPPYLKFLFHLSPMQYPLLSLLFLFSIISGWLIFWYLNLQKTRKIPYVYLEVKPTDRTLKSPLSTTQLFTYLHSLITPDSSSWLFTIKKSISFELISTKEQGIRFILRVPKGIDAIVYKNLLAYLPGIEVNFINDYLGLKLFEDGISKRLTRQELKFKDSYLYPLKTQDLLNQFDPIAFTTAHMTKLLDREMVAVQFIATPVNEATHYSIIKVIKDIQKRLSNNLDISDVIKKTKSTFLSLFFEYTFKLFFDAAVFFIKASWEFIYTTLIDPKSKAKSFDVFPKTKLKPINELGIHKQQQFQRISDKTSEPLFETTVRLIVISSYKESAEQRLKGLESSFETFNSQDQKFKKHKNFLWNIENNFLQNLFKTELKDRLSLTSKNVILSASELSSMYHLPYTLTTKTEDLLQVKSPQLPSPLSLKQSKTKLDIVFAKNHFGDSLTLVGQTLEERRRHTYIIGATGTGKSTLLLHMIYQDIINGNGVCIIDPHGQLAQRLIGIIPSNRRKDVVYFNPYDIAHPIGLNLLELPKDLSVVELHREKDFICSNLIGVLQKLYDAKYSGPRMEHVLRNVILTVLELEKPTLFTIYELLTDSKFRKEVTSQLTDDVLRKFWKNEFEKFGSYQKAELISPITNKLGRFLTTPLTRNILNQQTSKLNFDDIMNNGKILICDLSKGNIGSDNSYFLGSLVIAKIQLTALRRIRIPENNRKDFYLYIDEFQNFATHSFTEVLSEARKYRLAAILAHQNTVQIDKELLETIIGNSGTIISFRTTSPQDEDRLLPVFAPKVEKGQMQNLPSYTFYIKVNALEPQDAFTGEIDDFPLKADENIIKEVVELSKEKYATKVNLIESKNITLPIKTKGRPDKNKPNKIEEVKE